MRQSPWNCKPMKILGWIYNFVTDTQSSLRLRTNSVYTRISLSLHLHIPEVWWAHSLHKESPVTVMISVYHNPFKCKYQLSLYHAQDDQKGQFWGRHLGSRWLVSCEPVGSPYVVHTICIRETISMLPMSGEGTLPLVSKFTACHDISQVIQNWSICLQITSVPTLLQKYVPYNMPREKGSLKKHVWSRFWSRNIIKYCVHQRLHQWHVSVRRCVAFTNLGMIANAQHWNPGEGLGVEAPNR